MSNPTNPQEQEALAHCVEGSDRVLLAGGPTARNRRIERAAVALLDESPTVDSDWQAPGMVCVPLRLLSDLRKAVAS